MVPHGSGRTFCRAWLLWSAKLQSDGQDLFSKALTLICAIKADTYGAISGAGLEAVITLFYCRGWSLKLNKPLLSSAETISAKQGEADLMRRIWADNNRNDMISEHKLQWLNNEIIGLLTQEAYGSTSEKIPLGYGFRFHSQKTMIILLSFTPSKLHSDRKAPRQSSGCMICISGFMGTRLKISRSNEILEH